ncbi:MAG: hypothetical protein HYY65_02085 [Candidatus Tectomicrobia bacterium]|uniref:Gfo/Idh/MocA-like oxidoreductase C-terminal domain-containing protein n=1 Tax=Tectimicrobiota bacterium TaxID=2528274 RepID=A0A932GN81_UNCTE|nr:hypothetical protein [Candidatus Tectomicrobia bacterium]
MAWWGGILDAGTLIYSFDRGPEGTIAGRLWGSREDSSKVVELGILQSLLPPASAGPLDDLVGKVLFARLGERFVRGIRHGRARPPNFEDGLRAQEVIAAILRSAAEGSRVQPDYG